MTTVEILTDAFGRVRESVHDVVDGLSPDDLAFRVDAEANSIAWLIWHLTRVQDDHIAGLAGTDQAWTAQGWFERFGLPFDPSEHGYGHDSAAVAAVRASAELLAGYHDATHARTLDYVRTLDEAELARVVDRRWDPPVTAAVRLVSVVNDDLQHVGQAAFVRGLIERR